ncbi:MAG: sigma-70 family RNA polymerase sigma factor [Firmicutes bacterium]|nr:sigma-70 family RNA polymerase sigma factor [Bacillota bacterium]
MKKEKFNRLLAKCRNKETFHAAYTELYNFFFHRIALHISYKYKNYNIGEDIAQSFFVKLMQMNTRITYEIDNPVAWVLKSCENLAKDYFELDNRIKMTFTWESKVLPTDPLQRVIVSEYEEKLNQLDPLTREIITMKIYGGYDLKEIARELNIKHPAARQKYSRGIKALK